MVVALSQLWALDKGSALIKNAMHYKNPAAGDVTNSPLKQIIIAMGSGATSALGAFDYLIRTPAPVASVASAA